MSSPLPPEKAAAFETALVNGRKIEAIKIYREATGAGLAEAKKSVETIEAEWRNSSPEKFAKAPSGKGCMPVLIVGMTAGSVIGWITRL